MLDLEGVFQIKSKTSFTDCKTQIWKGKTTCPKQQSKSKTVVKLMENVSLLIPTPAVPEGPWTDQVHEPVNQLQ